MLNPKCDIINHELYKKDAVRALCNRRLPKHMFQAFPNCVNPLWNILFGNPIMNILFGNAFMKILFGNSFMMILFGNPFMTGA